MQQTFTFDQVKVAKSSGEACVFAVDSTSGKEYRLSLDDRPHLSEDNIRGTLMSIVQDGVTLKYTGDDPKGMYDKIPSLIMGLDVLNNSIHFNRPRS